MSQLSIALYVFYGYPLVGAMFAVNVALYAWQFIRARRENRRIASLLRLVREDETREVR